MYDLVFDIENVLTLPFIYIVAFLVSLLLLFLFKQKYSKKLADKYKKYFFYFVILFSSILLSSISIAKIKVFNLVKESIEKKDYKNIEGIISNFNPAPYSGHIEESFIIEHEKFSYSDYESTIFYHKTKSHKGFIQGNGQKVKINYISIPYTGCLPFVDYFGISCPVLKKNKIIKLWVEE